MRLIVSLLLVGLAASCRRPAPDSSRPLTIGVAFETLQTEYWIASFEAIKSELGRRNIRMIEAIADGDANRQLEQVQTFVARRVDGIIVAPKDAHTVIPAIKAANRAGIPIVLNNRPPAPSKATSVTIGVDNRSITRATVERLCALARERGAGQGGRKEKALLLMGDLGDINAIGRRDGFDDAVTACADSIEVVTRVPTEWNQEKALAGITNGLQANPDISLVFSSSDFLLPSVNSALKAAGKYHRVGAPGHVLLGSFDGDATAYQMLLDRYLDADGVQDATYQSRAAVEAILNLRDGQRVAPIVYDPGVVIHQGNLADAKSRMWGAAVAAKDAKGRS